VEEPEPGAPFGVKGVGESATIVALPAVVAAIREATGLELNRAPVRPDDVAGLTGPVTTVGWPPVPDVPGQEPVPTYQGRCCRNARPEEVLTRERTIVARRP
jgi:hypothetical protein